VYRKDTKQNERWKNIGVKKYTFISIFKKKIFWWYLHLLLGSKSVNAQLCSTLRSRLQNQRSRVQISVVTRGFCDEQLHLLTSPGCLSI
jgi:hypothetical protein